MLQPVKWATPANFIKILPPTKPCFFSPSGPTSPTATGSCKQRARWTHYWAGDLKVLFFGIVSLFQHIFSNWSASKKKIVLIKICLFLSSPCWYLVFSCMCLCFSRLSNKELFTKTSRPLHSRRRRWVSEPLSRKPRVVSTTQAISLKAPPPPPPNRTPHHQTHKHT